MAKKVKAIVRLQIPAGKANPAPPVGPALGQHGVNIMEFCRSYNDRTKKNEGTIIPAEITIFEDRSFTFVCKTPPAAVLLKQATGIEKGSETPHTKKVAKISRAKLKEIAAIKLPDLNVRTDDVEAGMKIVAGTARSMGIEVSD